MKNTRFFTHVFIALLGFSLLAAMARASGYDIKLLATFDYPSIPGATILATYSLGINDAGDIAGQFTVETSPGQVEARGFIRYADGSFSAPIIEPNEGGDYFITLCTGIANNGDITGNYLSQAGVRSFILTGDTFTEYQVPGATATYLYGINDVGDLVGQYDPGAGDGLHPFLDRSGTIREIRLRTPYDRNLTSPRGINNAGEFVGYYDDGAAKKSGFFGFSVSRVKAPITFPGADNTYLYGLNDAGLAVGYFNLGPSSPAVLYQAPSSFTMYRYPGVTVTIFRDINNNGLICGDYSKDTVPHGILLQATPR